MTPEPATASPPLGRSVVLQAWSGLLAGLALLMVALRALYEYTTYTGDEPLIGVLLLVAVALAVPGVLGVALGGCALALRNRRPGVARVLAHMAFVVFVLVLVACALRVLR